MERLPLDRARWPFIALLASAAMLASAYAIEIFALFLPCQMCWWQRYVYFAAGGVALLAIAINWFGARPRLMAAACVALGLIFLTGMVIAGWHALVEWDVLPPLHGCVASGPLEVPTGDLWSTLDRRMGTVSCEEAPFRIPLGTDWGVSMAGANALVSLALAAFSFIAASRPMRTDTANEPVRVLSDAHEHV